MCFEDIKLGRQLASDPKANVQGMNGPTPLIRSDVKRTRIIWMGDGVNVITVWPKTMTGQQGAGVVLSIAHPVQVIRIEDWGPLVCEPWLGADGGAGATVSVALVTLERME